MNRSEGAQLSQRLANGVMAMLRRRRPPEANLSPTDHQTLEDLVQKLTAALSVGATSLSIEEGQRELLERSGWLTDPPQLMVLDGDQLHWKRWHQAMQCLEKELIDRSHTPPSGGQANAVNPPELRTLNAEQRAAVHAITRHRLVMVSGGPGTGKTSTVQAMLLQAMAEREALRIHLAAPTGKAARRLEEALQSDPQTKGLPCTTLHRLLEARPGGFGRNSRHPLNLDVLVVDEASMVDLSLAQALLAALPQEAQLVLVGDANQLPPIGVGAVWQHLQHPERRHRFGDAAISLHKIYRNRGDLARLGSLLRNAGDEAFWNACHGLDEQANVALQICHDRRIPDSVSQTLRHRLAELGRATAELSTDSEGQPNPTTSAELLSRLDDLIVLCPRRRGPWGVDALHRDLLQGEDPAGWPEGLPVLCSENQMDLGLANGDLGLTIGKGASRRFLFRCNDGNAGSLFRLIHPARIRQLEPALALTIHKAQGSEVTKVIVLWPPQEGSDSSALLYTAMTRARQRLMLYRLAPAVIDGMLEGSGDGSKRVNTGGTPLGLV